jgi:light-regulated signal transduction histidine kinase (bacteriophytochrome)
MSGERKAERPEIVYGDDDTIHIPGATQPHSVLIEILDES